MAKRWHFIMKRYSLLKFKTNFNKLVRTSPVILTAGDKKAYIVLPYEQYEKMQSALGSKLGQIEEPIPAPKIVTTPEVYVPTPEERTTLHQELFTPKPSLWQRIKSVLMRKVL